MAAAWRAVLGLLSVFRADYPAPTLVCTESRHSTLSMGVATTTDTHKQFRNTQKLVGETGAAGISFG